MNKPQKINDKPEWQPIETAPKDGSRILLFFPVFGNSPRQEFGRWEVQKYGKKPNPYWSGDCEATYGVQWYRNNPPSHWMPPMEAPNAELTGPRVGHRSNE